MHSRLTGIAAQEHIADLRRAADHNRRVYIATRSQAVLASRRVVTVSPVTLIRWLRHRLAKTHPAGP